MINRVSSAGLHTAAVSEMLKQQANLARTQAQVGSGLRIQTPADDPVAAVRIIAMEQTRAGLEQFGKNSEILASRLGIGEQALADVSSLLQSVRDRAVQANNGALGAGERRAIAVEIRSRAQDLLDIANRSDGNGEYLFGGYSTQTQPFARSASGVTYSGDQGVRSLQIGPDQHVADGFAGSEVFLRIPEGNGTFATAAGVHTGTGSIDSGSVTNQAAWVPDSYTLGFTSATNWEVRNSSNALVASGTYSAGSTITFNGASMVVSGAPAAGDTFTIAPATTKDVFRTLDDLATALEAGDASMTATVVAATLTQIDQALGHIIDTRAVTGARLGALDSAQSSREQVDDQLAATVGALRDLDYAAAISRMNQQLTGLQAAQAAYTRIAQLSLFNYL